MNDIVFDKSPIKTYMQRHEKLAKEIMSAIRGGNSDGNLHVPWVEILQQDYWLLVVCVS
jgi:hypothetical protein